MTNEYILIVTDDNFDLQGDAITGTAKGWGDEVKTKVSNIARVPADLLEDNMNRFLRFVGRLFKQVDAQVGTDSNMQLDEVELSLEISGQGEVKLVAGAEAKSAITMKFKRVER